MVAEIHPKMVVALIHNDLKGEKSLILLKQNLTPGPDRDQHLRNEPTEPMINLSKWMVVHVKWPKLKSCDQGFFNGIKITDFFILIYGFLESFRNSLEMTPKNHKLLYKNL